MMKYKQKKPIVYCAMSGDIIHHGHINILKIANSYGYVVLGILTNKAISEYKDTQRQLSGIENLFLNL